MFAALAILSLGSNVAIYRVYRAEARRIGDNSRKFPLMMGFISCVLLIQLSMRVSQLWRVKRATAEPNAKIKSFASTIGGKAAGRFPPLSDIAR